MIFPILRPEISNCVKAKRFDFPTKSGNSTGRYVFGFDLIKIRRPSFTRDSAAG